jgi:hypothetical protein
MGVLAGTLRPDLLLFLDYCTLGCGGIWKPLESWSADEAAKSGNLHVLREMKRSNEGHGRRTADYVRLPAKERRGVAIPKLFNFDDVAFIACQRGSCELLRFASELGMPVPRRECLFAGRAHAGILEMLGDADLPPDLFASALDGGFLESCKYLHSRLAECVFSQANVNAGTIRSGPEMYWWLDRVLDARCSLHVVESRLQGPAWESVKAHRRSVAADRRE